METQHTESRKAEAGKVWKYGENQRMDGKLTKGGLYEELYGSLLYHTIQLKYN